jgi:hypothetical protein
VIEQKQEKKGLFSGIFGQLGNSIFGNNSEVKLLILGNNQNDLMLNQAIPLNDMRFNFHQNDNMPLQFNFQQHHLPPQNVPFVDDVDNNLIQQIRLNNNQDQGNYNLRRRNRKRRRDEL